MYVCIIYVCVHIYMHVHTAIHTHIAERAWKGEKEKVMLFYFNYKLIVKKKLFPLLHSSLLF